MRIAGLKVNADSAAPLRKWSEVNANAELGIARNVCLARFLAERGRRGQRKTRIAGLEVIQNVGKGEAESRSDFPLEESHVLGRRGVQVPGGQSDQVEYPPQLVS